MAFWLKSASVAEKVFGCGCVSIGCMAPWCGTDGWSVSVLSRCFQWTVLHPAVNILIFVVVYERMRSASGFGCSTSEEVATFCGAARSIRWLRLCSVPKLPRFQLCACFCSFGLGLVQAAVAPAIDPSRVPLAYTISSLLDAACWLLAAIVLVQEVQPADVELRRRRPPCLAAWWALRLMLSLCTLVELKNESSSQGSTGRSKGLFDSPLDDFYASTSLLALIFQLVAVLSEVTRHMDLSSFGNSCENADVDLPDFANLAADEQMDSYLSATDLHSTRTNGKIDILLPGELGGSAWRQGGGVCCYLPCCCCCAEDATSYGVDEGTGCSRKCKMLCSRDVRSVDALVAAAANDTSAALLLSDEDSDYEQHRHAVSSERAFSRLAQASSASESTYFHDSTGNQDRYSDDEDDDNNNCDSLPVKGLRTPDRVAQRQQQSLPPPRQREDVVERGARSDSDGNERSGNAIAAADAPQSPQYLRRGSDADFDFNNSGAIAMPTDSDGDDSGEAGCRNMSADNEPVSPLTPPRAVIGPGARLGTIGSGSVLEASLSPPRDRFGISSTAIDTDPGGTGTGNVVDSSSPLSPASPIARSDPPTASVATNGLVRTENTSTDTQETKEAAPGTSSTPDCLFEPPQEPLRCKNLGVQELSSAATQAHNALVAAGTYCMQERPTQTIIAGAAQSDQLICFTGASLMAWIGEQGHRVGAAWRSATETCEQLVDGGHIVRYPLHESATVHDRGVSGKAMRRSDDISFDAALRARAFVNDSHALYYLSDELRATISADSTLEESVRLGGVGVGSTHDAGSRSGHGIRAMVTIPEWTIGTSSATRGKTLYRCFVETKVDKGWITQKRYSDFKEFHAKLIKMFPKVANAGRLPQLPGGTMPVTSSKSKEQRRVELEYYVQALTSPQLVSAPSASDTRADELDPDQLHQEQHTIRDFVLKQFLHQPRSHTGRGL